MLSAPEIPLRIGLVSFLNMFPFSATLARRAPEWSIISAPPAYLLEKMLSRECDVAMIPAFGYLTNRDRFGRLEGTCIASRGRADSVFLLSDVPLQEAESLELDSRSKTSNALAQILMKGFWQKPEIQVRHESLPANENSHPRTCVRIGDRAMRLRSHYRHVYDLGAEWMRWQGLPFVFAVWATQGDKPWDAIAEFLKDVLKENLADIRQLLDVRPAVLPEGISAEAACAYLTQSLRYVLGPEEIRGLERYGELIVQYQLG